jgi:hypothetical protein
VNIFLSLIRWLWRAWPVLNLVFLFCAHLLLLYYFSQSASFINKTTSLVSKLVGGLLVLYSIDSNIGVIKQKSLFSILANYFKEFPLIKRPVVIEVPGGIITISGGRPKITVGRSPQNIEDKIDYLQEQINELKRDFGQESKELNEKIDRQSTEMNSQIQVNKSALQSLESKMDEISTGGINVQLFGVLLMVYGAIAGYAA